MPFQDIIQLHFTAAEQTSFDTLVAQLEALLQPKLRNLDEDENQKYGVIDEQNKLFVNKVKDYRNSQPSLSSPDVDWVEFAADGADRPFLENGTLRLEGLTKAMTETRRLHDYDNYQNSLLDYSYTKYKNETQPGSGYDAKAAELKQFFTGDAPPPPPPMLITFLSAVTDQNVMMLPFSIGIRGFAGDVASINWGDGNTGNITLDGTTQNIAHSYLTPGIYTIEIKGNHPERIIELLVTHASLTNVQPANNLTALEVLNLEYNPITNFTLPNTLAALNYVSFFQDALNETSINSILQIINGFNTAPAGASMLLHGGTNAAPTGQGIAAKNELESRGWAVATN